jgi:hypothetical protein
MLHFFCIYTWNQVDVSWTAGAQITFSSMDTSRVLINLWLWEWMLQCMTCVVMDRCNYPGHFHRLYDTAFQTFFFFLVYHYHNTEHVPLGIVTVNAYFQNTGLPWYYVGWQFGSLLTCWTAKWGKPEILQLLLFWFIVIRQQMSSYQCYNNKLVFLYTFYKFFLYLSTCLQQFW